MKIYVYPNGWPLKELMKKLHESILLREKSKKTRLSSREIGNHFAKCVWGVGVLKEAFPELYGIC